MTLEDLTQMRYAEGGDKKGGTFGGVGKKKREVLVQAVVNKLTKIREPQKKTRFLAAFTISS